MTKRDDLVSRLRRAQEWIREPDHSEDDFTLDKVCDWMNRRQTALYLEAATALEAKDAEIARLKAHLTDWTFDRAAAQSRISSLERQLAEETERCAVLVEEFPSTDMELDIEGIEARDRRIAAAIRGCVT